MRITTPLFIFVHHIVKCVCIQITIKIDFIFMDVMRFGKKCPSGWAGAGGRDVSTRTPGEWDAIELAKRLITMTFLTSYIPWTSHSCTPSLIGSAAVAGASSPWPICGDDGATQYPRQLKS